MKTGNVLQEKSYAFALDIVNNFKSINFTQKEYVLSKQLLRSATSVGANVEEAIGGQSERDFYAKLSISYKEARETKYWLRLLRDSQSMEADLANKLLGQNEELLKIIGSIQKTIRNKRS